MNDETRRIKRLPRPMTPDRLEKAALHYLERYASSRANLERILRQRVLRSAQAHGNAQEAAIAAIAPLLDRLQKNGLLDDEAYALSKARSLFRQGDSRRRIALKLRQKGLATDLIDAALQALEESLDGNEEDYDLLAARRYAQRRRLGPYRVSAAKPDQERRDLAALARQGFTLDIARKALETNLDPMEHQDFPNE
jgi:regulatory protein